MREPSLAELASLPADEFNKLAIDESILERTKNTGRDSKNKRPTKDSEVKAYLAKQLSQQLPGADIVDESDKSDNVVESTPTMDPTPASNIKVMPKTTDAGAVIESSTHIKDFMQNKMRVTFISATGEYTVPCVCALTSVHGICLVFKNDPNSPMFIPTAGADLEFRIGTKTYKGYYPGTCFEFPLLNAIMVTIILSLE